MTMPQTIDVSPVVENGHSLVAVGNGHSNGGAGMQEGEVMMTDAMEYVGGVAFKPLWEGSQVDRREFVRLAMQTFKDLGYTYVHPLSTLCQCADEEGWVGRLSTRCKLNLDSLSSRMRCRNYVPPYWPVVGTSWRSF